MLGAMGIDFPTWPWAETVMCAVGFSGGDFYLFDLAAGNRPTAPGFSSLAWGSAVLLPTNGTRQKDALYGSFSGGTH